MNPVTTNILMVSVFLLFFLFLIWLILREVFCWYYKINERISLQKETNTLLEKLLDKIDGKKYRDDKINLSRKNDINESLGI